MEIKEKKVVTECELKSDVFNFSDKTNFSRLEYRGNYSPVLNPEFVVELDSIDFGSISISIVPEDQDQLVNLNKLAEMIKNNFEVKHAK